MPSTNEVILSMALIASSHQLRTRSSREGLECTDGILEYSAKALRVLYGVRRNDVDPPRERVFQIATCGGKIEQREASVFARRYHDIDVAFWARIAARNRPEYVEV